MKLKSRDKRLLFELDMDSRQPLTALGKKLRISKEAVFYKISELEKRKLISYSAIINLSKIGLMHYKLYLKLQNINKDKKKALLDYLVSNDNVNWVASCRGTYDIICGFMLKGIFEFSKAKQEIISRFSDHIHSTHFCIMESAYYLGRKYLHGLMPVRSYFAKPDKIKLDSLDFRILKKISTATRMKSTQLARELQITPKIAAYRVARMQKEKVIIGYTISLDHAMMGLSYFKTFFYLKDKDTKKKLLGYLAQQQNCIYCMDTIANWDMEAEFEVFSTEEFYRIMDQIEENFSGSLRTVSTLLIEKEHKNSLLPKKVSGIA